MAKSKSLVTVDFETEAIEDAPYYPPTPVSVAIKYPGRKSVFYAWGHPTENNCTRQLAYETLFPLWADPGIELLFQNAKFDLEVAYHHFQLPYPHWQRVHDTMFLLFLNDPRGQLSLKPASEEILGILPEEQDELHDWIIENIPEARRSPSRAGAYIAKAPGKLVGKYAKGDTDRTYALYRKLMPEIKNAGMLEAYDRERRALPIIMKMEKRGIRMDREAIRNDIPKYQRSLRALNKRIQKKVGNINLNSSQQLSEALLSKGLVHSLPRTPKGNYSVKIKELGPHITDVKLLEDLRVHSAIEKMLTAFLIPWTEKMDSWNVDRLYPSFNQVRGERYGTRTGRLSSSRPNFQQLNREPSDIRIPFVRKYVLPEEGHVLLGRDYSQQELRILAHYEAGSLQQAYIENPETDLHSFAQDMIEAKTGVLYPRPHIKNCGFGIIYGVGGDKLGHMVGADGKEGRKLKADYFEAFPSVQDLMKSLSGIWEEGLYIRTRGGRVYYAEEVRWKNGRLQSANYKALNTLIQGSAADHTKEATILLHDRFQDEMPMLLTVHDEFLFSAPEAHAEEYMEEFKHVMNFDYFDVPMRSDGKIGNTWGTMEKINE